MKTITIRDLRQRWPEAEAALAVEDEIIITRDSIPVARLMRVTQPQTERPRWNPEQHRKQVLKSSARVGIKSLSVNIPLPSPPLRCLVCLC